MSSPAWKKNGLIRKPCRSRLKGCAYAHQAKNKQLEVDAAEIRFRAERRLGELIQAQKETVGLAKGGQPYQSAPTGSAEEPVDRAPTLAEAGIDKKLSSRAQKLAAIPEQEFESHIGEWRSRVERETERVTTNLLREGGASTATRRSSHPLNQVKPRKTVNDTKALHDLVKRVLGLQGNETR